MKLSISCNPFVKRAFFNQILHIARGQGVLEQLQSLCKEGVFQHIVSPDFEIHPAMLQSLCEEGVFQPEYPLGDALWASARGLQSLCEKGVFQHDALRGETLRGARAAIPL